MNNKPTEKLNYSDYPVGHKELWDKQCEIIDRLNAMSEANKPAECFGDMVKEMYKTPRTEDKFLCSDRIHEHIKAKAMIEGKIEILNTLKVDADKEIARLKEQNK